MSRIIERFVRILLYLPMGALVAMVLVEMAAIIGPTFGLQATGSVEVTAYLGALVISFSLFYCTLQDANVVVNFLIKKMGGRKEVILNAFASFISIGTIALLIWPSLLFANKMVEQSEISMLLNIKVAPFRYVLIFAMVLMMIVFGVRFFKILINRTEK